MIKITLPDGSEREYEQGVTPLDIAQSISRGLAKVAVAAKIDGKTADLTTAINKDANVAILTMENEEGKDTYWHTSAHIMAQAVQRLYPGTKLWVGPSIENGFYYDFDPQTPFTPEDLPKIEAEMNRIIKENLPLKRFVLSRDEAIRLMEGTNEPYKVELIKELPEGEEISFYQQGEFVDLCVGSHLPSTGSVKAIKLLNVAGAYLRGDQKNRMLTRIYGIAFPKKAELDEYLTRLEEAKKRDHKKLGRELGLFDIFEEGPGFPFYLPKGMVIRNILEDFWRSEHTLNGYHEIKTPIILNEELWHRSGHYAHYKENMYSTTIDETNFMVKPMNCPGSMIVYKRGLHSYRDLPLRMGELGLVHRHELSGALNGLLRVRCFTQDDAHIFMTPEHVKSELIGVLKMIDHFYSVFGFDYSFELSTRPESSMGSDEQWDLAISSLREALEEAGKPYKINEGDGAFYGPKIDCILRDSIGRTWQCGTIQLDFQMPEKFDLTYIGQDGEKHRPIMIHRVIYGSIDRFMGVLIEHYAGAFPLWLAPVQVKILPVSQNAFEYSQELYEKLQKAGIRVNLDTRNEKIGYKIREA